MIKYTKLFKAINHILVILLLTCNITLAKQSTDNDYYQVELIIFEHNNNSELTKENWPLTELIIPDNSIKVLNPNLETSQDVNAITELANYKFDFEIENNIDNDKISNNPNKKVDIKTNTKNYYKLLNNSDLEYINITNKIKSNTRYKLISHIGWRLPKKNAVQTKPIYFETGTKHKLTAYNNPDKNQDTKNTENTNLDLITPEISGVLKLEQKKFVHSDLQVLLSLPASITNKNGAPFELIKNNNQVNIPSEQVSNNIYLQSFKISETRRLRYKEVNYFDHPIFGVIVVIS